MAVSRRSQHHRKQGRPDELRLDRPANRAIDARGMRSNEIG
jgi:hypothetical protein